jgi:hypothetical protein
MRQSNFVLYPTKSWSEIPTHSIRFRDERRQCLNWGNVSEACKVFGYSHDSFYRFKELYENGGDEALKEVSRKMPRVKNRVEPAIEEAILKMDFEKPAHGQVHVSNELKKQGHLISPVGVRSVWLRHDLETF